MKTLRIELRVIATVHVGEDIAEDDPAPRAPSRTEEIEIRRLVPLGHTFSADVGNAYATAKAHTVSALAGIAGVLPEKLGHAAREMTS